MPREKISADKKMMIVLEELRNEVAIVKVCRRHQTSWTTLYRWQGRPSENGRSKPDMLAKDSQIEDLKAGITQLTQLLGDMWGELIILKESISAKEIESRRC